MATLRTPEEKETIVRNCVSLEKAGEDVLAYLKTKGYVTPAATWQNIQKRYLGRDNKNNRTDGKYTGKPRKGRMPKINEVALEDDRIEWEKTHGEKEHGGNGAGGMPENPAADVRMAGRDNGVRDGSGGNVSGCRVDAEKAVAGCGCMAGKEGRVILTPVVLAGKVGRYVMETHNGHSVITFRTATTSISMEPEEWLAVSAEIPEVLRMMGVDP